MGLRSFLCKLFGCEKECPEVQRPIDLVTTTALDMNAPVGDRIIGGIGVQALYADDLSPAAGAELQVSVVDGPGTLGNGLKEQKVTTGTDGTASLDVEMTSAGYSLYEVALTGDPSKSIFFASRTNEMTAQIFLYTQPCQPASAGQIEVEVSAIDYDGNSVSGTNLSIDAHNEEIFEESSIEGQVTEVAPGRYKGIIKNDKAGGIMLISQDLNSKIIGRTIVHILPGPPDHFQVIGSTDPRAARPYNYVDVQVQLQDKLNNPLPPTNIQARTEDGIAIPLVLDGDNAFFRVEAVGYQYIPITLLDPNSEIKESVTVIFAATWLSNPGITYTGNDFATPLHVTPRPDTSTDHGTVTIKFDPELVEFKEFKPSGLFKTEFATEVVEDKLILKFDAQQSYATNDFLEGMYLGDCFWSCLGDGDTCFALSGQMSPSTDPWELCVKQKTERNDCICINVISIAGNAASLTAGNTTANNVSTVVSSAANVSNCCPVLTVQRHNTTITQAQLNAIVGADGTVSTRPEQNALHANGTGVRANCINIKSVPVAITVPAGTVRGNTDRGRGSILINPGTVATHPNAGVHEVGHVLDLDHRNTAGALMRPATPVATGLNDGECEEIFKNLSKYPC